MKFELTIQTYFQDFNQRFFGNKLKDVKLEFSSRMKNSAGVFSTKKIPGKSGTIRLNKPLLSSRSDKEVKETLLVSKRDCQLVDNKDN